MPVNGKIFKQHGAQSRPIRKIEELRLAIVNEFRSLPDQLQEKLSQKPVLEITDEDIVATDHLLQGLENAEFWGDLRSEKRPNKETTKDEIGAMNQRIANFRKSSCINMLQYRDERNL